jgi:hypothetical protein
MASTLSPYPAHVRREVPWSTWIVGLLVAMVLAGGVAQVIAERTQPKVTTTVEEVHVLPPGQAIVRGTLTSLHGTDVLGPTLPLPLVLQTGRATIRGALTGDGRATLAWDGGRPLRLEGEGGVDLGPTTVDVDARGRAVWPLVGVHRLVRGRYVLIGSVALGTGGLARPRDQVDFLTDGATTLEAASGMTVPTAAGTLHLDGPGSVVLDGAFTVETRAGRRAASHLEFGPGPLTIDLTPQPDGTLALRATLQGALR